MKKLIIFLFLPLITISQNKVLTYQDANDINIAKQYKNDTEIYSYTTKNGMKISVGDVLTIGNAEIKREEYMINDVFKNIVVGNVKGTYSHDYKYLSHKYSGDKVVIHSIYVKHVKYKGYNILKKRNEMPLYVCVYVRNVKENKSGISAVTNLFKDSRKTILDIDKALDNGEIISDDNLNNSYRPE